MQESGQFTVTTESTNHFSNDDYDWGEGESCPKTCAASDNADAGSSCCGKDCKFDCNNQYFGRGYVQRTWRKNYVDANANGGCKNEKGNSVDIVENPEEVATDENLAWCTLAYFWKKMSTMIAVRIPLVTWATPSMQ